MVALLIEGWDKYGGVNSLPTGVQAMLQAGEWSTVSSTALTLVAGLSSTGQALRIAFANATPALTKNLGTSYARLIGGVRFQSDLGSANSNGIAFQDGGTSQCTITINPAAGTISLRNGTIAGTALATSSTTISANSTHYLEWDITFGNTGAYQVWLDGVSLFSGTGDTTTTANNTASQIAFTGSTSTGQIVTFDDFYLFDSTGSTNNAVLLTSPRIETTFPTADSAVQFAVGAGILGSSVSRTASTNAPAANSLLLRRFTPSASCTLNSIIILPNTTNGTVNNRGVIYADSGGTAPGTLMSSGTQVTGTTAGAAATLPLTTPQTLSAGTQYWLGYMTDSSSITMPLSDGNLLGYRANSTYSSGAPGTAPAMTSGQSSWLFWGNITGAAVNYDEVNQQPPDGQYSYVYDATVGHEDLYTFAPLSATPGVVHTVAVKAYTQKSDSGTRTVSMRTKSGSTDSAGSLAGQAQGTSFGWLASYFPTDPNTSAAWTGPNLDAATSGFKIDS
jgi:hypothetical protein